MMNAAIIATVVDRKFGQFHIKNGSCMSNCLAQFKYLGAFDRKDHVYAILGLWQFFTKATMLPDVLKPDYTLSVCEVFTRATRFAIEESQRLHIMERVSESPPSSSWPSWVPVLYDSGYGKARSFSKAASYKADGSVRVIIQDGAERPDALVLSGFSVSSIAKVTPICIPRLRGTRKEAMTAMACCDSWDECHEDGFEAKISLVLIDGTQQGRKVTTQQALRGYRSLKEYLQDNESFPPKGDTPAGIYWSSFRVAARSRAVFLTENGHICVGPKCSQAGDIVAILYGSRLPMVMRPLPVPEPDNFRLLGASHVYGIMNGEAVRRHKEMGIEDTVFRIL